MRKLFFALAMLMVGAFAFGAGSPAGAVTAGSVTGMSDVVKADNTLGKTHYRRRHYCWYRPYSWRCRHRHHHHRRHHYRRYWW
jgi:hypothetical protein